MLKKGIIILTEDNSRYEIVERLDDLANGEGGWLCINTSAMNNTETSPYNYWRVTDKYLNMQIMRGAIKILEK